MLSCCAEFRADLPSIADGFSTVIWLQMNSGDSASDRSDSRSCLYQQIRSGQISDLLSMYGQSVDDRMYQTAAYMQEVSQSVYIYIIHTYIYYMCICMSKSWSE